MSNYPDNIRDFNNNPDSPFYEDEDEKNEADEAALEHYKKRCKITKKEIDNNE